MKNFKNIVVVILVLLLGVSIYPKTPCACLTPKMASDRLFGIDVANANAEELTNALASRMADFTDKDGLNKLSLASYKICDFEQHDSCKLVIKQSLLFQDYIILTIKKDESGKIIDYSVMKS